MDTNSSISEAQQRKNQRMQNRGFTNYGQQTSPQERKDQRMKDRGMDAYARPKIKPIKPLDLE
jgi:hypothetical protein